MSENYIERYGDSIGRSIEFFALDFFKDNYLEYLIEPEEDSLAYVDGLYLKDEIQYLYLFSSDKIKLVSMTLEKDIKVIKTTVWKAENLNSVSLIHKGHNETILVFEFNDDKITLNTNNVLEHWKTQASKRLKKIYQMYY